MKLVPVTWRRAVEFVREHHRHHPPSQGCRFAIGAERNGVLVGVVIAGRPVSRHLDDGNTLEVTRLATDGTRNACSALYAAVRRAAPHLGYQRVITYTLQSEGGASLRGAGWRSLGEAGGGSWSRESRVRVDAAPLQRKILWEAA